MKATAFKESNFLLKAGNNPNTDDMAACICNDPLTKLDFIVGRFKISAEELQKINETGHVYIAVMGRKWAPMSVTPFNPFSEFGEGVNFVPYDVH